MSYPGGPPFPPPPSTRYSPSRPFPDRSLFPDAPPPPPRSFPPFAPNYNHSAPPPAPYRPYDNYNNNEPPRPPFIHQQPRPYDAEHYDPYQPSSNGFELRPVPTFTAQNHDTRPQQPPAQRSPPARRSIPPPRPDIRTAEPPELTLLTSPTEVNMSQYNTTIYSLPESHLPILKYVCTTNEDAINLHNHICQTLKHVWYADGSSRAGEGWSAAVEWILDPGRSGSKMRGCVGESDALDAELGGICKAIEGFQESLQQSIKSGTPLSSHILTVFCDSQAAIASIDTSSRPESLRFCNLWKSVCSEFLKARMDLVWIPKQGNFEGQILADKIAVVGATNSYLKRKKSGTLPDIYARPGGGESAPGASCEAGPWQRGDADPSRRKTPFERPLPLPIAPTVYIPPTDDNELKLDLAPENIVRAVRQEPEEEGLQAKDGSLFVTYFPKQASAKDLGILFAQYGDIVAVDIFSVSTIHPRFALITFTDAQAGDQAIQALHRRPIALDTEFARENSSDLEVWQGWDGVLTVIRSEPGRLVPSSVMAEFPPLPDWATGARGKNDEVKSELGPRKREREQTGDLSTRDVSPRVSPPSSIIDSPSPHKRPRGEFAPDVALNGYRAPEDSTGSPGGKAIAVSLVPDASPATSHHQHQTHTPVSANRASFDTRDTPSTGASLPTPINSHSNGRLSVPGSHQHLPPTPVTAQRSDDNSTPATRSESQAPLSSQPSSSSKPSLTNSAAVPQEIPIQPSSKTLKAHISLVRNTLVKHDVNNWIAHACLIATDLDTARRALQADLYATDEAFLAGRDFELTLSTRGFTPARVDSFIKKVLGVLDGIAMADELDNPTSKQSEKRGESVQELQDDLDHALKKYPEQTREAIHSAGKVLEYLIRGKEAQEKKRIEVERRVKVLEGMVKIGEVVGGVVRFLLTDSK